LDSTESEVGSDVTTVVEGFGFTLSVAPNETADGEDYPEGRALNRRVEISYPRP
jgi:outer membrane protein OmpA-like peptidoglycan-associated protein